MITTNDYIQRMECPVCRKKKLSIWASQEGEGDAVMILLCSHCRTSITTPLIPDTENWIVHKTQQGNKRFKKLWNQA